MSDLIKFPSPVNPIKTPDEIKQLNENALIQQSVDEFYDKNGPCCAGCDNWRWFGPLSGECINTAPVSQKERLSMMGLSSCSLEIGAGHIITRRGHVCGEFIDTGEI